MNSPRNLTLICLAKHGSLGPSSRGSGKIGRGLTISDKNHPPRRSHYIAPKSAGRVNILQNFAKCPERLLKGQTFFGCYIISPESFTSVSPAINETAIQRLYSQYHSQCNKFKSCWDFLSQYAGICVVLNIPKIVFKGSCMTAQ